MIIYGASGHGKVIADIVKANHPDKEIIFADDADKGTDFYGHPLYQTKQLNLNGVEIIIAIGNNRIRKNIASQSLNYVRAIHPSAVLSPSVQMGEGTVIMAQVSINADVQLGKHVIVNTSASIDHDCTIENYAHISPCAALAGNVTVGEGAHVGIGASIIQGIKIGKFATVGAGSVVIRDVPDGATVVGCPAEIIKTKNL